MGDTRYAQDDLQAKPSRTRAEQEAYLTDGRAAWVLRVLGIDVADARRRLDKLGVDVPRAAQQPPPREGSKQPDAAAPSDAERFAAAKRRFDGSAAVFRTLSGNLGVLDNATVLIEKSARYRETFAALEEHDAAGAEDLATGHGRLLEAAQSAFDLETDRRKAALPGLLTLASSSRIDPALLAMTSGAARLEDEARWTQGAAAAAREIAACRDDRRLGLLGSNASEFNAAAAGMGVALKTFAALDKDLNLALAAETSRRERAAGSLQQVAQDSLGRLDVVEKIVAGRLDKFKGTKEVSKEDQQGRFNAAMAKTVPGWAPQARSATRKAVESLPGDGLAALGYGAFDLAMQSAAVLCDGADKLAADATSFLDLMDSSTAAYSAAMRGFNQFKEDHTRDKDLAEADSKIKAAFGEIQKAAKDGRLDDAQAQSEALKQRIDAAALDFAKAEDRVRAFNALNAAIKRDLPGPHTAVSGRSVALGKELLKGCSAFLARPELAGNSDMLDAATTGLGQLHAALLRYRTDGEIGNLRFLVRNGGGDPDLLRQVDAVRDSVTTAASLADPGFVAQIGRLDGCIKRVARQKTLKADASRKTDELYSEIDTRLASESGISDAVKAAIKESCSADPTQFLDTEAARFGQLIATLSDYTTQLAAAVQAGLKVKGLDLNTFRNTADRSAIAARQAIREQITRANPNAVSAAIDKVTECYNKLGEYGQRRGGLENSVEGALGEAAPRELGASLAKTWSDAEIHAKAPDHAAWAADLDQAERLARIILATSAMFAEADVLIREAPATTSKDLAQLRAEALSDALEWRGGADAFVSQGMQPVRERLPVAAAEAYAALRSQVEPGQAAAEAEYKLVSATLAAISEKPKAPADPAALWKKAEAAADTSKGVEALVGLKASHARIAVLLPRLPYLRAVEALEKARKASPLTDAPVAAALATLVTETRKPADPETAGAPALLTADNELMRLAGLLPDIAAYATKLRTHADYQKQIDTAPPKLKGELEVLFNAADLQKFTNPVGAQGLLDPFFAHLVPAKKMTKGWGGAVPDPVPNGGRAGFNAATSRENARAAVAAMVAARSGGLTLADVEGLVPAGQQERFEATADYPKGSKFKWRTHGVELVVYFHGPVPKNNTNVAEGSPSRKGNIVRVKIDGQYLQNDGSLSADKYTEEGHLPLFGNP